MSKISVVGCTRVKDGERYMDCWISDMLDLCDILCILDDGSTDKTPEIIQKWVKKSNRLFIHTQKGLSRDGGRDCRVLHNMAAAFKPDWIFAPDVDEFVDREDFTVFRDLTNVYQDDIQAWTFPFFYLWDQEDQYRMDGDYYKCHVIRLYRFDPSMLPPNRASHAQMCPDELDRRRVRTAPVRMVHYGYMDAAERRVKYDFYTGRDKDPIKAGAGVDNYRHIISKEPVLLSYPNRQRWRRMVDLSLAHIPPERMDELAEVPR